MNETFAKALAEKSDIQQHLGLLHGLATHPEVHSIVEIGVRSGLSTAALCAAGKPVTSYDIEPQKKHVDRLRREFPNWTFIKGDSREVVIPSCELLFIDGEHTYATVRQELWRHSGNVSRWIVLHDTTTFGETGRDGQRPGLTKAIEEFLGQRKVQWCRLLALPNNNGLTILERTQH